MSHFKKIAKNAVLVMRFIREIVKVALKILEKRT